jgi:hypothetical protein
MECENGAIGQYLERTSSSLRTASRRYSSMALEYFCRMLGEE